MFEVATAFGAHAGKGIPAGNQRTGRCAPPVMPPDLCNWWVLAVPFPLEFGEALLGVVNGLLQPCYT